MKLIYLLPFSLLLACSSSQDLGENDPPLVITEEAPSEIIVSEDNPTVPPPVEIPPHNVQITITHFTPYCGGAAPSEEMLNRRNQLQSNTDFILLNRETFEKVAVQTNDKGTIYLKLPKGRYAIRELYKDCTFAEFVERNPPKPGNYLIPSPDSDCYKNWWESNLGEFEITDPASVQHFMWGTGERCFSGINPCVEYNGPYPP